MQLLELQAYKQTRTDVLISTGQICYGKMFYAPLYFLRWYVFLALCVLTCTSALSQICQGRALVTALTHSNSSLFLLLSKVR